MLFQQTILFFFYSLDLFNSKVYTNLNPSSTSKYRARSSRTTFVTVVAIFSDCDSFATKCCNTSGNGSHSSISVKAIPFFFRIRPVLYSSIISSTAPHVSRCSGLQYERILDDERDHHDVDGQHLDSSPPFVAIDYESGHLAPLYMFTCQLLSS